MNTIIGSDRDKNKITHHRDSFIFVNYKYVRYYHEHEFVRPVVFVFWLELGAV